MSVRPYDKPLFKQEPPKDQKIVFSFELLDYNEYYNIDCTCSRWSLDLVNMLQSISSVSRKEFVKPSFRRGTYRIHNHKNVIPPVPTPKGIDINDMCQIRLEKTKGGIHGKLVENVFYVIWLDPLHNLYPDERYGGLKKIKTPQTCCCDMYQAEIQELSLENQMLQYQN